MLNQHTNEATMLSWKHYGAAIAEVWIAFCIATFSAGMFFSHLHGSQMITNVFVLALYIAVVVLCIKRISEKLPISAIMLLIPIAPLCVLLLVVSLIPIIEQLN